MSKHHLLNQENLKLHINNDLFQSKLLGKTMLYTKSLFFFSADDPPGFLVRDIYNKI